MRSQLFKSPIPRRWFTGQAGGTDGDPGLRANATPRWQTRAWPAALRLQPGRTAPTLRRRDDHVTQHCSDPDPDPRPLSAPSLCLPLPPAKPSSPDRQCAKEKETPPMQPYSAAAGPRQRVFPLRVAAEAPLSLPGPQACSPAPLLLLNPSVNQTWCQALLLKFLGIRSSSSPRRLSYKV